MLNTKVKKYLWIGILAITLALCIIPVYQAQRLSKNFLVQASNLTALMNGVYDGDMTFAQLKQMGDFGLGTFDMLDGELVVLDGSFYQIKADGVVYPVSLDMKTPFAAVTFFRPEREFYSNVNLNYEQIKQAIDKKLLSTNLPYAIRIYGEFTYLKFRSVPKQTPPYQPFKKVLENQVNFEKRNIKGTLVGFRMPSYTKGINQEGYHFHFISDDTKVGGHLMDGEFQNINVEIQILRDIQMMLPSLQAFNQANLQDSK